MGFCYFPITYCGLRVSLFGLITGLAILQADAFNNRVGKHVSWVDLDHGSEAISLMTEPAGMENGLTTFLCRGIYGGEWKPGALIIGNGQIYCHTEYHGARKLQKFQILDIPRGTTGWVPYSNTVPNGAIIGGAHANGEYAFACRALIGSNVYIGSLSHLYRRCYIAVGNNGTAAFSNLEVLSINHYGTALADSKNTCRQVYKNTG